MNPNNVSGLTVLWMVSGACSALLAAAGVWALQAGQRKMNGNGTLLLCVALAALAFYATGFALAMGGSTGLYTSLGPLSGLNREWIPFGPGRGIAGLKGIFLSGASYDPGVYVLFLFQSAALILAAVIALAPWVERAPRLVAVLFSVLFGGLLYPLYVNWVWGGGWLAHLGQTHAYGHGVVDFAGSGVINGVAGLTALGALLALMPGAQEPTDAPPEQAPSLPGLLMALLGWLGLTAATMYGAADTRLAIVTANVFVAFVCACSIGTLYTWFASGEPDAMIGAQSGLGGLAAVAAGAPFIPAWAAAVIGGVAGLLVPFAAFVVERITRARLSSLAVVAHGFGGVWGLLAAGLLADGSYGIGWNGVGERTYLGMAGQGVTGSLFAGPGPADPTQFSAQVVGAGTVFAFMAVAWLFVRAGRWAARK